MPSFRLSTVSRIAAGHRPAHLLSGAVAALSLALLAGCGPSPAGSAGGDGDGARAFEFGRSKMGIIRTDTRNGRVWGVPLNGDGGWVEIGQRPDLAGLPASQGRFESLNVAGGRSGPRGGDEGAVLLRVDHATGRTWLLESAEATTWTPVRDTESPPDVPTDATTEAPSKSTSADTPSSTPSSSRALDESSSETYPILTGDRLGSTPEEKQQSLETLHTAITREELPLKMRLWAVRQIGELDPELAVPELLAVLDDGDPAVVAEAVRQLGRIGQASTIPRILALQNHPDAEVRQAVSETVVQVK